MTSSAVIKPTNLPSFESSSENRHTLMETSPRNTRIRLGTCLPRATCDMSHSFRFTLCNRYMYHLWKQHIRELGNSKKCHVAFHPIISYTRTCTYVQSSTEKKNRSKQKINSMSSLTPLTSNFACVTSRDRHTKPTIIASKPALSSLRLHLTLERHRLDLTGSKTWPSHSTTSK